MTRANALPLVLVLLSWSVPLRAQEQRVEAAQAAAKSDPKSAEASIALGRALRRAGRAKEATTELGRGLAVARGAEQGRARYELMRAWADQKHHENAMAACNGIREEALRRACAAEVHVTVKKRGTEAVPEIEAALKKDAGLYEVKYVEGLTRALMGELGTAEAAFGAAIAKDDKRGEAFLGLGRALEAAGREADAVKAYRRAVAVDGDDPDALYELARLLPPADEARALLEKATKGRPSFGPAWARLAEIHVAARRGADALTAAEAAVKLDAKQADWHAVLAEARVLAKKWDDALLAVKAALALAPYHGRARLAEGDALAGKGDIDQAIQSYQAAYGALRTDPTPLVRAAIACLAAGNRETSAKGFADRATREFPKWAPAWEVAGDVAVLRGERAEAIAAYEKALTGEGPVETRAIKAKLDTIRPAPSTPPSTPPARPK